MYYIKKIIKLISVIRDISHDSTTYVSHSQLISFSRDNIYCITKRMHSKRFIQVRDMRLDKKIQVYIRSSLAIITAATCKNIFEKNVRKLTSFSQLIEMFAQRGGAPWRWKQIKFRDNRRRCRSSPRVTVAVELSRRVLPGCINGAPSFISNV